MGVLDFVSSILLTAFILLGNVIFEGNQCWLKNIRLSRVKSVIRFSIVKSAIIPIDILPYEGPFHPRLNQCINYFICRMIANFI